MQFVNIADLKNPETGKTYRQENNEKTHKISLGTLVEVDFNDEYCETPLYSLSFNKDWKEEPSEYIPKIAFKMQIDYGYREDSLKVVG